QTTVFRRANRHVPIVSESTPTLSRNGNLGRHTKPRRNSSPDSLPMVILNGPECCLLHRSSYFIGEFLGFVIPPRMHLQMIGRSDWAKIEDIAVIFENYGPAIETARLRQSLSRDHLFLRDCML